MIDRWIEKLKAFAAIVTATTVVTGFAYAIISGMGFVISRAEAEDMIALAVQAQASQSSQALLDEVKARQIADLNFQLAQVNENIKELLNAGQLSRAQEDDLEQLKKKRDQINQQIEGLQQ